MQELGFTDTYRTTHPTVLKNTLRHTWTTVGTDYVYKSGKGYKRNHIGVVVLNCKRLSPT